MTRSEESKVRSNSTLLVLLAAFLFSAALPASNPPSSSGTCAPNLGKLDASQAFISKLPPFWAAFHHGKENALVESSVRGDRRLMLYWLERHHRVPEAALSETTLLGRFELDARIRRVAGYQRGDARDFAEAAESFEKAKLYQEAGRSWEYVGKLEEARRAYVKAKDSEAVARVTVLQRQRSEARAFRRRQNAVMPLDEVRKAAEKALAAKDYSTAAGIFTTAQLYMEAGDASLAAGDRREAARSYEKGGDFALAAAAFIAWHGGHEDEGRGVAELYRKAGMLRQAMAHDDRVLWNREHYFPERMKLALRALEARAPREAIALGEFMKPEALKLEFYEALRKAGYKEEAMYFLTGVESRNLEGVAMLAEAGKLADAEILSRNVTAHRLLAEILEKRGKHREAGDLYLALGEWEGAERSYRQADRPWGVGMALIGAGRVSEGRDLLRSSTRDFRKKGLLQQAIWGHRKLGEKDEADKLQEKLRRILSTGKVRKISFLGGGKTPSYLIELEGRVKGVFKPDFHSDFGSGANEEAVGVFDRLLGTDYVPFSVQREIEGLKGSIQYFVGDAMPGVDSDVSAIRQSDLELFDFLIGDAGRHPNNQLVWNGQLVAIDNAQAFTGRENKPPWEIEWKGGMKPSAQFLEKLRQLTPEQIREGMTPHLSADHIEGIIQRRSQILEKFG